MHNIGTQSSISSGFGVSISADLSNCSVGKTLQICNRVTNPCDMDIFFRPECTVFVVILQVTTLIAIVYQATRKEYTIKIEHTLDFCYSSQFHMATSSQLFYYFGVRCARPGESEDTLSVQRPQPHTTNPWKEEKDKTVGDKKERAGNAYRKALALLLKPTSHTPSNKGSLRSFQRDTERGTKLLQY